MKRIILSLNVLLLSAGVTLAQQSKQVEKVAKTRQTVNTQATPATSLKVDDMAFKATSHDFGTVSEGPAAQYEFTFINKGNEPITVQKVQASCGCTTPSYSKDPVLPGHEGIVKASFNTNGRPGSFTKSITVTSNAGVKVLMIKGTVEKAPTSSVPESNSMVKTN